MRSLPRFFPRVFPALLATAVLIAGGCSSPPPVREPDGLTPQPRLVGKTLVMDGAVEMKVTLSPAFTAGPRPEGGAARREHGKRRRDGGEGEPNGGGFRSGPGPRGAGGMVGLARPTHRIQVWFTNVGQSEKSFFIDEVRSPLGVFAVRPSQLTLAPGQSAPLDPMLASYGARFELLEVEVTAGPKGGKAPVKVTLLPVAQPESAPQDDEDLLKG